MEGRMDDEKQNEFGNYSFLQRGSQSSQRGNGGTGNERIGAARERSVRRSMTAETEEPEGRTARRAGAAESGMGAERTVRRSETAESGMGAERAARRAGAAETGAAAERTTRRSSAGTGTSAERNARRSAQAGNGAAGSAARSSKKTKTAASGKGGQRSGLAGKQAGNRRPMSKQQRLQLQRRKQMIQMGLIGVIAIVIIALGIVVFVNNANKKPAKTEDRIPNILKTTEEITTAADEILDQGSSGLNDPGVQEQTTASSAGQTTEASTATPEAEDVTGGETVYATTVLNVRSQPNTSGEKLGKLAAGEAVVRTANENGWSTITYNGVTAYVSSEFLTTEAPQTQPQTSASMSKHPIHEGQWDLASLDGTPYNYGNAEASRQANMVPGDWSYYENLWGMYNVDWIQDINSNTIYLTMDVGFDNEVTAGVLDTLKEKNVKVVFFVTKMFFDARPDLIQRMLDEGHIIGNHTCTHRDMPSLSLEEQTAEIMDLHNAMKAQFGYEMKLFRFPEGAYSHQSLALVENLGYKAVFWSYAYDDYSQQQPEVEPSYQRAVQYLHPGAIFLLHASSSTNGAFLGRWIDSAREKGHDFGVYPLEPN